MSVKGMNETLRPDVIVPSSIGFRKLPKIRAAGEDTIHRTTMVARATDA